VSQKTTFHLCSLVLLLPGTSVHLNKKITRHNNKTKNSLKRLSIQLRYGRIYRPGTESSMSAKSSNEKWRHKRGQMDNVLRDGILGRTKRKCWSERAAGRKRPLSGMSVDWT
jgi:hypothetical protein